jgi:hypothetical protein
MAMEFRPLANIFPLMEGPAFDALVADISANGLREPLVMFEDMLLDGRNRWRACAVAHTTITDKDIKQFDPKKDGDPLAWVISKNRNRHELLLVGRKGKIIAPAAGTQWSSVIEAPVGHHAAKPEEVLEMIEAYYPTLPKIELNRRGPARPGWDAWGNEVTEEADIEIDETEDDDVDDFTFIGDEEATRE